MKKILKLAAIILAIILVLDCWYYVAPGKRGTKVTLGKVSEKVLDNGIGLKWPYISRVISTNVRTVKLEQKSDSYTKDNQTATVHYTFSYNVKPSMVSKLYENVGKDYEEIIILPTINDAGKDVIGNWEAQSFVPNRETAKRQITEILTHKLDSLGGYFENYTVYITNCDYSDEFEKAIEAKVKAEQKALEAKNNTIRIEEEAKQKVITAEAEAKAMEIKAQALEKNKSLVEYEAVLRWNGELPSYMLGNSIPFLNLSK